MLLLFRFRLFTRQNKQTMDMLDYKPTNQTKALINASHFDPSKKLKVIIHGFINTAESPWIPAMKDELLKRVSLSFFRCHKLFTGFSLALGTLWSSG